LLKAIDIALAQAIKNAGLNLKAQIYSEGYDETVLGSSVGRASVQGDDFGSAYNWITPNGPTQTTLNALVPYDPAFKQGDIPDLGIIHSYLSTITSSSTGPTLKSSTTVVRPAATTWPCPLPLRDDVAKTRYPAE